MKVLHPPLCITRQKLEHHPIKICFKARVGWETSALLVTAKMSGYSPSKNKKVRQSIGHQGHKIRAWNMRDQLFVRELELEPFIISHP